MPLDQIKNQFSSWQTFIKFCVVGVLGTLIDVGSLYVFVYLLDIKLLVATTLAFLLAVINNFLLNKFWTFKNPTSQIRKQFIKFLIVSVGGLILTLIYMSILVYVFHIVDIIAKLITSGLVLLWNFLVNKNWTFREKKNITNSNGEYAYEISVVIPMYNEEERIEKTLDEMIDFCKQQFLSFEIILVDDGSIDQTIQKVEKIVEMHRETFEKQNEKQKIRLIKNTVNHGKGYVVKQGMLSAQGKNILFTDADNSTPVTEIPKLLQHLNTDEVSIGSRYIDGSSILVEQPNYRVRVSRMGNKLIQFVLLDGISDTQCGFKGFQHNAAKQIFSRLKTRRFGFDMEALVIARFLNFQIAEIPVKWTNNPQSRVRPVRDTLRTLWDLFYIKLNILSGRYE